MIFRLSQVLATVAVGLSLAIMTSVSGVLIDKAGRRNLLLVGTTIMAVALGSLSISLFMLNASPRLQGYLVRFVRSVTGRVLAGRRTCPCMC